MICLLARGIVYRFGFLVSCIDFHQGVRGGTRGVRHKLLIFNCVRHAFESSKRKHWPSILMHWVSQSCRSQRCEVLMPTRTSAFRSRTFLRAWCLRERLAMQAMWWNRPGDYAGFLSAFSPEMDSLPGPFWPRHGALAKPTRTLALP